MPLSAGARLGPYEILSPIGAGGMGEVYRARDTRLDRTVAIKVLPEHLSSHPELRERFEREAKAISSLSHPHICALYDIGCQDGIDYLVMEHLQGETLAQRLKKGPLPIEQVLRHSIDIAAALDTAHRHGVIHRDLKPGNIMLTKSGAKLLDFGLAKMSAAQSDAQVTALLTGTTPLTGQGTAVGTLQYMAPEQLEGAEADARSDIFALGAVIYEMATGKRAFEGKGQASLITAIMTAEPAPISGFRTRSESAPPAALDHVVRLCMAKDPEERWQAARDVVSELKWIAEAGSQVATSGSATGRDRTRPEWRGWAFAAVATLVALVLAAVHFREKPAEANLMRFLVSPPDKMLLEWSDTPVVSPDGQRYVFAGILDGRRQLWVRALDSPVAQPVAGTDDALLPFWSPDSRFIAFFSGKKLKKIDPSVGLPKVLCDAPSFPGGGAWSKDGIIMFVGESGMLQRVSAEGGAPQPVYQSGKAGAETGQAWPDFLPDGRHFLYLGLDSDASKAGIYLGSLDSGERRLLISAASSARYAPPGFLIYGHDETLLAQRFDVHSFRLTGEPFPIAEHVGRMAVAQGVQFSVSENGVLAYRIASGPAESQLAWYGRDGKRLAPVGEPGPFGIITLSPDDKRLAVERSDARLGTEDLWILELGSGVFSRLTFDPSDDTDPVWSPDGRQLLFASNRKDTFQIYRKVLGGGEEELLFASPEDQFPKDWSKDGRSAVLINESGKSFYELPLAGERKPLTILQSEFNKDGPHISPDAHWIAYASAESGRWEVYVARFPSLSEKRQISASSGSQALWRKDGKELFYLTLEGKLMVVEVRGGATLETGPPKVLFQTPLRITATDSQYCVTADGKRFIFREPVGESMTPFTVVLNWTAGLKR